jgi:3-oxoacyl-[acyl-carrier protein] reductase
MLLEGKNAIVTGGSQGIGTAASLELAKEGANVCLTYRRHADEARAVVEEIEGMGRKAICVACDIAVFTEAENAVNAAMDAFGRIDIMVNNAGMNWDGVCWKMSEEQWDRVIDVNLKGYFNFTRQVAPRFKEQKYGKIINVTSINGMRGKFGTDQLLGFQGRHHRLHQGRGQGAGRFRCQCQCRGAGPDRNRHAERI